MLNLHGIHIWTLKSSFVFMMNHWNWCWFFKSFTGSEFFSIKQQCWFKTLQILARKQEKGYFSRTSWFRNATASFCVPIASRHARAPARLLAGLDLPQQSILHYHTHTAMVCNSREKLLAHMPALITQKNNFW